MARGYFRAWTEAGVAFLDDVYRRWAVCRARRSGLAIRRGYSGAECRCEPLGMLVPGLIERRVEQAPQDAGLVERRLTMPDKVDQRALHGLCRLARCSSHLVASAGGVNGRVRAWGLVESLAVVGDAACGEHIASSPVPGAQSVVAR